MLNKVLFGLHCFLLLGFLISFLLFFPLIAIAHPLGLWCLFLYHLLLIPEIVVGSILCCRGVGPYDFEVFSCPNS